MPRAERAALDLQNLPQRRRWVRLGVAGPRRSHMLSLGSVSGGGKQRDTLLGISPVSRRGGP